MYESLKNANGDTVIQNVGKCYTFTMNEEIEPGTWHPINYIELPDGSVWWNCEGSDLIWGPHESIEAARLDHQRVGTPGTPES